MIRVMILYPLRDGARFDTDYYLRVHMPDSIRRLGPSMRAISVVTPVAAAAPWPAPAFAAICTFECDSREVFEQAFFPNAEDLQGDIPNFTDIEPLIQVAKLEIDHREGTFGGAG